MLLVRTATAVLALGAALALGACGGEERDARPASAATGATSPARGTVDAATKRWREEVAAVCRRSLREASARLAAIQRQGVTGTEASVRLLSGNADVVEDYVDDLRVIDTPARLRPGFDAVLGALESTRGVYPRLAASVRTGEPDMAVTDSLRRTSDVTVPFFRAHGLRECTGG